MEAIIIKKIILTVLSLTIILALWGCTYTKPTLKGFYQSERVNGYIVQISFQQDVGSFVEYIDSREVDKGTYEKAENNAYKMKSDKHNFEIILNDDNSFEIMIKKINNGNPIRMKNLGDIPTVLDSTKFNDVDEYKVLLD